MDGHGGQATAWRESLVAWSDFISRCISQRLDTDRFELYAPLVHEKHPLPAFAIADFFLRPQPSNTSSLDPRIPPYIQVLTRLGYVDSTSILKAMYKYSTSQAQLQAQKRSDSELSKSGQAAGDGTQENGSTDDKGQKKIYWKSSYWAEEVLFYHVIKTVVESSGFRDSRAALEMVMIVSKWMELFTAAANAFATEMLDQIQENQAHHEMEMSRAAFVPLLLRVTDNEDVLKALRKREARGVRKQLSQSLGNFLPNLQLAPHFVERLEMFRTETLASLDPLDSKKQEEKEVVDELLEATVTLDSFVVQDMPIANSRAGLYIYINALLVGRPLIDDHAVFAYLNNRYQGDTQTCAIDLILASFDVLSNAVFRNEAEKDAHLLKSYLINKVPLLLCQLFPPGFTTTSAELCITEALNQVDTSMFPTASLMFDESRENNPYTESVREEFCAACALHGLVDRGHVDQILGEVSMSYEPSLEKSSKEKLVENCLSDSDKIQNLVREIDKMDGNVGAVCHALVEVLRQLCNNKETGTLKTLCVQLAQKPKSLDVLLLFEKMPQILEPLCQLLDNWRYDDDQVEYQPVYDEFGGILLLVLTFSYRYKLSGADLGLSFSESYVCKILDQAHIPREGDDLTEQASGHLNSWILGLFDSDSGGLGDDLMSSCIPQEFYLLVATLFQQVVVGYAHGFLNEENLKGGIEYLVDTFLLPSLVPAILYLSDAIWPDNNQKEAVVKILQLILIPSSISGEASAMLSSVKNLVAKPLDYALRAAQRRDPRNQDITTVLEALKENAPLSRRTGYSESNEVEQWCNSSSNGLVGAVRHTFQGLVQWSIHPAAHVMPGFYSHRQIIAGTTIAGSKRILHGILEEVKQQSTTPAVGLAYDVAVALIASPDVTNEIAAASGLLDGNSGSARSSSRRSTTLWDALKQEAEDCGKIQKKDPVMAEIVVRLYRRVEAQLALPPPQPILADGDMQLSLDAAAADLTNSMGAGAGLAGDAMQVDSTGLDMGLGGGLGDLDLGAAGSVSGAGGLDSTGDADLFELDPNMDFDNWDSMGL